MKGLTYSRCGDYYIPDLKLSEQAGTPIGKYGRMRKRYLEKHRPIFYNNLILTGRLYPHLLEIDKAANEHMDTLMPQLMEAAGVDEALKAADQIRWVGLMNTLKAQAEETILSELIFGEGANKMLSFDRILQVFDDILRQDLLYEVVSTSHGYTLLGWEPNREEW